MTEHFNRTGEKTKRRMLRHNPPEAERQLWQYLKSGQLGIKFRRQYSVDAYVIDFYAVPAKLAVEIDGDSHFTTLAQEHDNERTAHLRSFGIDVIRFTNAEVLRNVEGVLTA